MWKFFLHPWMLPSRQLNALLEPHSSEIFASWLLSRETIAGVVVVVVDGRTGRLNLERQPTRHHHRTVCRTDVNFPQLYCFLVICSSLLLLRCLHIYTELCKFISARSTTATGRLTSLQFCCIDSVSRFAKHTTKNRPVMRGVLLFTTWAPPRTAIWVSFA